MNKNFKKTTVVTQDLFHCENQQYRIFHKSNREFSFSICANITF